LLGYGGPGHDGPYLTDSMMLVIVDQDRKSLTLLSIPRDSWAPLEFDGRTRVYNKLNTAYAFAKDPTLYPDRLARYAGSQGAGAFAEDTVAQLVGIPISYYVGLDFQGFREMIDTVGGVAVDAPASFTARYPANDNPEVDPSWMTVHFYSGPQVMDGERAIEFARAREVIDNADEASDFARSRRQRLIMEAFKTKVVQPSGLLHLPKLLAIAAQHVDTDYSLPNATQLGQMILDWKDVQIYQTALSTTNYLQEGTSADGGYVLVPSAPGQSWSQVRAFGRRLWDDPALGVAMARTKVAVVNRSGSDGLASRVAASLLKLGYQVGDVSTDTYQARSRLIDRTDGQAAPLARQLRTDLDLPSLALAPDAPTDTPEVVLELGADAADLALAVPTDLAAPTSSFGVVNVGSWIPGDQAAPTPPGGAGFAPPTPVRRAPGPTVVVASRLKPVVAPNNPNLLIVPKLVGMSEAEAQRAINESGLMTTYVNYQSSSDVADKAFFATIPPGAVLSQQPPPGTAVPPMTRIALAVRKR
jgi:LCP family protein required for cell wall assembly